MSTFIETRETRQFAHEIKFLIDRSLGDAIQSWARARLAPDPYAAGPHGDDYRTTSVYFDTAAFDVAHRRGSNGRSKYRVRRYGDSPAVFLERKLRTRNFLTKRRSIVAINDLDLLENASPETTWSGEWFHKRLLARGLRPVCQISYSRTARIALTDAGPARLTIDDDIRSQPVRGLDFASGAAARVLDDQVILELKYRVAAPAVFKELIGEFRLAPQPLSKYRLAAKRLELIPSRFSTAPAVGAEASWP